MHSLTLTVPVAGNKCQFTDAQIEAISAFVSRFDGKAVSVTWARPKSVRSLRANAYLWGVVYPAIAEHTGMTTEDIHEWCKDEFLPRRFVTLGKKEKEIRKTTSDLSVKEFAEYIDRVCAWASTEFGVLIPTHGA